MSRRPIFGKDAKDARLHDATRAVASLPLLAWTGCH
jgi:hypothetical protein